MTNPAMTILLFAVAVSSTYCARLTRPDRNYYPMQRVLWTILGFVYGGAGLSSLFRSTTALQLRAAFALAVLAGTIYSIRFMRQRNRTPRYIALDLLGARVAADEEHLRRQSETVTSLVRHGAAPEAWVAGLEEACAEWRRLERWKREGLPAQAARRRALRREGAG